MQYIAIWEYRLSRARKTGSRYHNKYGSVEEITNKKTIQKNSATERKNVLICDLSCKVIMRMRPKYEI